ncbi:hypothetical protein D0469_11030 [Peribacillus saganii]|uniref:Uncharacterized protein n=1 Tax=Peribacillus saganii TaxID=2303992 RepID=A0A372LPI3_9BACI|nr:hypothetical protein [Peribacillus saganii]RFU69007.1 hypothetical protein D0469_11030 [Peribacillus saganii]
MKKFSTGYCRRLSPARKGKLCDDGRIGFPDDFSDNKFIHVDGDCLCAFQCFDPELGGQKK